MGPITDVVKNLIIINIIVFLTLVTLGEKLSIYEYFILHPIKAGFQPYQIVSSMFSHVDPAHIFFNMFSLYVLGSHVERVLGPKRFLILYLASGILSGLAHIFLTSSHALGASGAINGVVVCFALMFPNVKLMIFPIPFEVRAIVLVGLYLLYDLFGGLGGIQDRIAHFAHLGGALMGAILTFYWGLSHWSRYR